MNDIVRQTLATPGPEQEARELVKMFDKFSALDAELDSVLSLTDRQLESLHLSVMVKANAGDLRDRLRREMRYIEDRLDELKGLYPIYLDV